MEKWWEENEQADPVGSTPPDAAQTSSSDDWWKADNQIEAKQTLEGNALSRGLSRGADMAGQFYGSTLESVGKATGLESLEESGRARAARNRAELQASTPSMTTEDIDGVGSTASFVGEKLGESAIPIGTSIAAAAGAGALAGSVVPGLGTVAGAIIGGGAAAIASLPYMFGSFRERQKDEDITAGRPIEVDEGAALAAALPAAALEGVSDVFLAGPLLKVFKPLAQSGNILTRVTTNAATGASVESLTEVGQTVLERYQAGLSLTDEEAQKEYYEAAVAGGLVGGTVSGAANIRKATPTVEDVGGGTDAAARSALRNDTTRTESRTVDPDQAAALGGAPAIGEKTREIMAGMRAKSAAAAPSPVTAPAAAPVAAPAPEPVVTAPVATPPITPPGNVAPPVSTPTVQVQNATEQVAAAPVIPEPADAPIIEGTELDETLLSDTALNEEVTGAEAAGDTLPTVPEAPETLAAQGEALVDRKNKRKAVYIPPETLGEVEADALPMGKNVFSMRLPNGGMLFWNYTKIGLSKKDVTNLYNDGKLGQLLGLGPFNKAEVAASGGTQDLAVVERTAEGVPVKEVGATEVTAPAQIAALEAEKTEGSTIEVVPAADAIAERQAVTSEVTAPKATAAKAKSKGRAEQAPVRTLKDIDPEEVARIEAAANAKPAPKPETPKAEAAKKTSTKRTVDVTDAATRQRNVDAADEQAFLRKRAALEEETRVKKEEELAARKAEVQKKIEDNAFDSVEDEATARIEANRTAESKDKGRDAKKISLAVKAGRLADQLREAMKARAGNRRVTGFVLVSDLESAKAVAKEMRAVLVEAKKQGITIGKQVDDTVTNAMAFLIDLRTTTVKLEKLPSIDDDATREAIIDEANGAVMDLNAYLLGNDAAGIRERRASEGEMASGGAGELDVDGIVDENSTLDRDEETDETDPDDFDMAPTAAPVRAIEIDESIPTYTAGVSKTVKVEVRKSRASARAAYQQSVRDRMMLAEAEKPLGKDADQKLVETLRPDDIIGLEIIDRVTSSGKALGDMTLAERTALFKDMDGVDPKKVEESLAIAKLPLSNFQALLEGKAFLRALSRNLKFMDAMPAAIQKALGTDLLAQMNRIAGDVEVLVVDDADMPSLAPGKDGYFWSRGDYIVIRASLFDDINAARLQHVVTHEAGHAAMWHAIRKNPRLRGQLEAVLGAANKYADRMGITEFSNGLRNVDEFASELVSNPRFQDFLTGVTLSKADLIKLGIRPSLAAQVRNALDAIKIKLLDAIGWSDALRSVGMDPNTPNALTAGLDIIGNLLDVAPAARTRFQQLVAESEASLGKDSDTGIYGRLKQRGLDDEQALNVAAVIDQEFGGTATDEELDALAGALSKPIGSQQGLTGPSPFMPPKLPGRVAKLLNWNPNKASKLNRSILYLSTLDFIDTSFRKYFGDKAGNALSDYVNAAFKFRKVSDDIAALHDLDFADFADLKKSKPAEALKIQKLVGMLEAVDVDISDGATNDHLKGTNARKLLQSKAALPEIKKIMASMDPETLALVRRMAKNFTESHNDYLKAVTYTILEGLDTKLSNSDMMRIMDHTINGKLDAQDKADVNDDAVFAQLERSEFLKKRKGSYFPAARFGDWVVTTDIAVADPKITSVVTKSGRKTVPITTEIDGGTVRFSFDADIRGARGAVTKKLYDWVANHELPLSSYVVKYRDRQTGEIVNKGEMDITRDYDTVHEIKLQNKGVHFFENIDDASVFQGQAAADKAAGKLLRTSVVLPKHEQKHRDHLIPPGALDAVFASIDKNQKIDQSRKEQLKNAARDAITRNMAGNRYEKRLMGRQNIIGASDDVGRAAAHYGRSVGNAIAQIRSGGERASALARMRSIEKARTDEEDGGIIGQVVNELVKREDLDMGPLNNNQLLDNLSTINSIDKLLSPANWFLNATQVPMNSLPYLGGRFGNVNAGRTILSAYQRTGAAGALKSGLKNTGKAITSAGKNRIDLENVIGSIRKNVGVKYNDLFDELISTNDITDNTGIENAQQLAADRGTMGKALVSMDRIMRAMPNAIEAINRSTAAVAAYDLALGSGMSKADAIAYARETLRRTQFRYDETNKSRMMRSTPALRFFFTFKQYGQGQYQMLVDALTRAFKDASPAERAMARKQLYTMFMMQIAVAGVFSVPAIELIKTAVMLGSALGLGEGWDDDVDEMRKFMRETYGETVDEIVSKGALSKILGVDLSGRMSWADLIVGYPPKSGEKQDLMAWVGNAIAGPQGSMVYEFFIGGPKALLDGDYAKGLTMMLPIKAASDTVKAVTGAADGKMDPLDAAKQVLGFKSLRQARISDETGTSIRERGQKKKEVNALIADYIGAVSRGDVVRAAAAIREYNSKLKEGERKINIGSRTSGLEKLRLENAQRYAE